MSKIKQSDLQTIREQFALLRTTEDLVVLLNCANDIIYPKINAKKRLTEKLLRYYAFHKEKKYQTFTIFKKNGKLRTISAPDPYLKLLQKCLNMVLNIVFVPHKAANGFVVNNDNKIRNIVTNAQSHTNKPYVYNIDLSDFFTSIAFRRIKTVLQLAPFNLPDDIAFLVANLCSDNGVLPQGAPTSPTLTNAVCQRLDRKLTAFAKTNKIRYTRYADDITFSGYENIFNEEFYNQLKSIIEIEESFKINESKVRLQTRNDRQEVTGLTVNEKVNVEQRYIRSIRAMLHNWQNKGLEYATTKFRECYVKEKGAKRVIPPFESVLRGKLQFLQMVRGENDLVYLKYWEKFEELNGGKGVKKNKETESTNDKNVNKNEEVKATKDVTAYCNHNPKNVTEFLKKFRDQNNSGLRELLHAPINPNDFDLTEVLEKIEDNFPFKADKKIPFDKRIPFNLWQVVHNKLINIYKGDGMKLWEEYKLHPLFNESKFDNSVFSKKILGFKKQVRFGKIDTETTILKNTLVNILNTVSDESGKTINSIFDDNNIIFTPEEKKFNAFAQFFTDVERVEEALKAIFIGILKYSNYKGEKITPANRQKKRLLIDVSFKTKDEDFVTVITITDEYSECLNNPEQLCQGGDFEKIKQCLWSLCEWEVQSYFPTDNAALSLNMMVKKGTKLTVIPIDKDNTISFVHKLTFFQ